MRSVSDEAITAQVAQPDVRYLHSTELLRVAISLNYTHDDYMVFAKACHRYVFSADTYHYHKERFYTPDTNMSDVVDIVGKHW
jgi:hypothetical protein